MNLYDYLPKQAEEDTASARAKAVLGGTAAFGVGTLAGAGAAHLGNKLYGKLTGKQNIPSGYLSAAAPIIGGGLGLAYNLAQAHQLEVMRRAIETPDNKPDGGNSGR